MILKELKREWVKVHTLAPENQISDAAELMQSKHIGSLVVVENQKVVGIVTDRDIAMGLALGEASADSPVAEIMTRDVSTIPEEMSLFDTTRFLRQRQVKRLPIVDSQDNLVGIISTDDITSVLARELMDTCSALQPKLRQTI